MMRIGYKEIVINPVFPVNRMLSQEKHLAVSDDLHCRIVVIEKNEKPFMHISIDTVEVYVDYIDRLKAGIEAALGYEVDLVVSATHSHFCPCLTTDMAYRDYLYDRIVDGVAQIHYVECRDLAYSYQYRFFDKTGKSRISGQESHHIYAETLSFYADGKRVVTVLMYNSHATTMRMHQGDFTSEYPGWVIARMKERYPEEFFTFMLGPAGEISSRFTRREQTYEEIARLAQPLFEEYCRQLDNQETQKPVDRFIYKQIDFPIGRQEVHIENMEMPDDLSDRERETIERALKDSDHFKVNLDELPHSHRFSHLILSDEYSIIFEPFETFSSYYGWVEKDRCSLVTISNGFDHYIPGLEPQRITMELFSDTITRETKENMARLFASWSRQEDAKEE